jgi:predicted nicotinamide N-methyase
MTPDQLRAITCKLRTHLVPEFNILGIPKGETLNAFRERHSCSLGLSVPYWAVAWPGGQALARYLLDNPGLVKGTNVVDFGCGNGLAAIAALKAGARSVKAIDIDPNALVCAAETARINGFELEVSTQVPKTLDVSTRTIILAGDLWYDALTGRHATAVLRKFLQASCSPIFADVNRSFRPRKDVVKLATYDCPTSFEYENSKVISVNISTFSGSDILSMHPPYATKG